MADTIETDKDVAISLPRMEVTNKRKPEALYSPPSKKMSSGKGRFQISITWKEEISS